MNAGGFFSFVVGMTLSGAAVAGGVEIPQVPANAAPVDNAEAAIKPAEPTGGDYQNEILSNSTINDRARAEAVMNAGQDGSQAEDARRNLDAAPGNTAIIVQKGKSNTSSIVQKGNSNYARQTQTGNANDLRVEQTGDNNVSEESQTGNYNHKVKIQNGNRSEETAIEQVSPISENRQ